MLIRSHQLCADLNSSNIVTISLEEEEKEAIRQWIEHPQAMKM